MTTEEAKQLVQEAKNISDAEIKKLQSERLTKLVNYARQNSPYFKELYKDLGETFTLQDLPITSKKDLMADYNKWPTDPEVTQDKVFEYLAQFNENPQSKLLGKYTALATSGTSGIRTPMVRDSYHNEIHGQMMKQRLLAGLNSDPRMNGKIKRAVVVFCDPNASAYSSFMRNKRLTGASDTEYRAFSILDPIDKLAKEIDEFKPDMLSGYPSVVADLAAMQLEGHMNIHPIGIACSAETMTPRHLELMRKAFGEDCHIINNFCSTEGGEIAMSCKYGHLHVNEDWIILEPVDENMKPVKEGEQSAGMLITDLSNFAQPIIRYYVDDHIIWHTEQCPCGNIRPYIEVMGRKGGVDFSFNGKRINTLLLDACTALFEELVNYQFVKVSETECQLRIVTLPASRHDEVAEVLLEKVRPVFHGYCGDDVKVIVVNGVPIHNERGGKMLHYIIR